MVCFSSTKFFDPQLLPVLVYIVGPNYLTFFVFELQLQEKSPTFDIYLIYMFCLTGLN